MKDAEEEEADGDFSKRDQGLVNKDEGKEVLLYWARLEYEIQWKLSVTDLICYGDVALRAYIPDVHPKTIMNHYFC